MEIKLDSLPCMGPQTIFGLTRELILAEFHADGVLHTAVCCGSKLNPLVFNGAHEPITESLQLLGENGELGYEAWREAFADFRQLDAFIASGLLRHATAPQDSHPPDQSSPVRRGLILEFVINSGCNLKCGYCYEGAQTLRNNVRADAGQLFEVIDHILETVPPGAHVAANFVGGEPLLNWDIVAAVADYIATKVRASGGTYALTVQTNLTFLAEGFISTAAKHGMLVMANIDGPEAIHNRLRPHKASNHNSYRDTLACLKALRQHKIPFSLRCTITALNAEHLLEIARLHAELGAQSSLFVMLVPAAYDGQGVGHLLPDVDTYTASLKRFIASPEWHNQAWRKGYLDSIQQIQRSEIALEALNCTAANGDSYTIGQDGHIYNCLNLVGNRKYDAGPITQLDTLIRSRTADLLARQRDPICGACAYRFVCGSACLLPKALCGNPNDPLIEKTRALQCATTKTIVDHLLVEMAKNLLDGGALSEHVDEPHFAQLNLPWRQWLADALHQGCTDEVAAAAMTESGFFTDQQAMALVDEARRELTEDWKNDALVGDT